MIQRCPKCGRWCESTDSNLLERGFDGFTGTIDKVSQIGKKYLGSFGEGFGEVAGFYLGTPIALGKAAFGDKYQFECPDCHEKWSTDDIEEDETEEYEFEQGIMELALSANQCNESERSRYIQKLMSTLNEIDSDFVNLQSMLYDALAYCSFAWYNDSTNAINYINKSLELFPGDPNSIALRGVFRGECRTAGDYYKKLKELLYYKKSEYGNPYYTKANFEEMVTETSVKYSEGFLSIPSPQRKFLVIDSELNYLPEKSFKVLLEDQIPGDIHFLEGSYIERTLYVCHRYSPNYYISFDNYQAVMLEDEVRELHKFLQGLGAKSVKIHSEEDNDNSEKAKIGYGGKVGGSYKGVGANVGGEVEKEKETNDILKKHLNFDATNEQMYKPQIIHSVWYDHLKEWQDMADLRMGGQLNYSFEISTSQVNNVSTADMQQLSVDFNALVASGNVEGHHTAQKEFKISKQNTWRIDVEFYPLSSYEIKKEASPKQIESVSKKDGNKMNYILIGIIAILGIIIGLLLLL